MKKYIENFALVVILACLLFVYLPRGIDGSTVTLDEGRCWSQATEHSNGYSIASFDGYLYAVYVIGNRGGIVLNQSSDGGDTWEKKWEIASPWDYVVWSVKVTVNSTGHVIVVSDDGGSTTDHQVLVWYSNGTGNLGVNEYTFVKYETIYNYEYVSLAVDDSDNLLIAGHDYPNDRVAKNYISGGMMKIYPNHTKAWEQNMINFSADYLGNKWRTFYQTIHVGEGGRYYFMSTVYNPTTNSEWGVFLYSDDNGSSWLNYSGGSISVPLDYSNAKKPGCNFTSEFHGASIGGKPLTPVVAPDGEVYLGTLNRSATGKKIAYIGRYNASSKAIEDKWNYTVLYASEIWNAEAQPIRVDFNGTISLYFSGEMLGVRNVMVFWKNATGIYQANITEQGTRDMNRVVPYCIPYNLQDNVTGNESVIWTENIAAATSDTMFYHRPAYSNMVPDTTPPTFSNETPTGTIYVDLTVSVDYNDTSGVNESSVRIWINGVEYTSSAIITNLSLSVEFLSPVRGVNNISVYAEDIYGNWAYKNWTFRYQVNETELDEVHNLLIDMLPFIVTVAIIGYIVAEIKKVFGEVKKR